MFLCIGCAVNHLTDEGRRQPWLTSMGKCEMCNTGPHSCVDVPSHIDWPWKEKIRISDYGNGENNGPHETGAT